MQICGVTPEELLMDKEVYVLRLGHRPKRDRRVTTHVVLVARAFGAKGVYIADVTDSVLSQSLSKVVNRWGGRYFELIMGVKPLEIIRKLKSEGFCIVHLTMYGLHIDSVIDNIRRQCKKILVIIGAEKVERIYYEISDYNIAIGNQPHSEVAALAIFLDRLWKGLELSLCFSDAQYYIIPSEKGKVVKKVGR